MVTSSIFFAIILLILVGLLVTPIVAMIWAGIADLLSQVREVPGGSTPAQLPDPSTEAMWHRMQGTAKTSRRRGSRS